jgi:transcriptional regulator with XRE-family HTH domain
MSLATMSLADRIRFGRYAKGLGPDQLARDAKISRTALYQIECGKTATPRAGTLRRIALALGLTVEELLGTVDWSRDGYVGASDGAAVASRGLTDSAMDEQMLAEVYGETTPISAGRLMPSETMDVDRKFHELLESPFGDMVARMVEESYRLLPRARERAIR